MKRAELTARILMAAGLLIAVGVPWGVRSRTPLIHVHMADSGGWSPDALKARAGEPLNLKLTSDDVMHGFAVGQMDMQSVDVAPGKVTNVTLNFARPGTYTFYCTRWCGVNHWRMRGTIEVSGPEVTLPAATPPLYVRLGLDIDAPHEAPLTESKQLSGIGYEPIAFNAFDGQFLNRDFYREHSPYEAWKELRGNPALLNAEDAQVWKLVALIWQTNTNAEDIAEGKRLFQQNCAACHGESGGGNGVFADALAAAGANSTQAMGVQRPADLADASRMLGASPALLQGKILRGGMGTGMPSWGPIFTENQTWKIVSYLYTIQFQEMTK